MNYSRADVLELSSVQVSGPLDGRIRLAFSHLLAERKRIVGGEGAAVGWGGDQFGRWIEAVTACSAYTRQHVPELGQTVREFMRCQYPTGFFNSAVDGCTWFGASRALQGLIEYWRATQDAEVLRSASRLGEFYLSNLPLEPSGFQGSHIKGLLALWRATEKEEYLQLAERIAANVKEELGDPSVTNTPQADFTAPQDSIHTHSYLMAMRGLVYLFGATGKPEYLQRAQDEWEHILQRWMWVSGGISEFATYPFETIDETCSVADWHRLSLQLWQATGEPRYMELAEHVLLNHLYFDQDHSGGFCSYRSIGEDRTGRVRDVVAWCCCSMHGLRALLETVKFIYSHRDDRVDINLFTASEAQIPLKDASIQIKQLTEYPATHAVRVDVHPEKKSAFCLRVRIPRWAHTWRMTVNGETVEAEPQQEYMAISRVWTAGDRLEISFAPRLRLVPDGSNGFSAPRAAPSASETGTMERAAAVYGPLVLMGDISLYPVELCPVAWDEIVIPRGQDGEIFLPRLEHPIAGRGEYAVPGMCFVTLGRKRTQHQDAVAVNDESWGLVFLVPISEITGRWSTTPDMLRPFAYDVRNNIRLLAKDQAEPFSARVSALFESFTSRMKSTTCGYRMQIDRL